MWYQHATHEHLLLWNVGFLAGFTEKPADKPTEECSGSISFYFGFVLKQTETDRFLRENRKTDVAFLLYVRFTTLLVGEN